MRKVLWLDLETTGLDEKTCFVLEVGALVTDGQLIEYDQYESVLNRSPDELATMNDWCAKTHKKSGLLDKVISQVSKTDETVEQELIAFVKTNFPNEKPILAGNSIHFDRKFLEHHYPRLCALLHHRMIDVSGAAEMLDVFAGFSFERPSAPEHRSIGDIRNGSMVLLRQILSQVNAKAAR